MVTVSGFERYWSMAHGLAAAILTSVGISSCSVTNSADLILLNGNVYTFTWDEPSLDGTPAEDAPHDADGWHPDAQAVAIRDGTIVAVGSNDEVSGFSGPSTETIDVGGATILPGLVDSHVHIAVLGANLERVILVHANTEAEMVDLVAERASDVPEGEWIIGWGWDDGAWAASYPDMRLLSERVPHHPVFMRSLHGFAAWGNRMAFERAGIAASTESPPGGEILKDRAGNPTGILLNQATSLLANALPTPTREQLMDRVEAGLRTMAEAGYVAVHEAGAYSDLMNALEGLHDEGRFPIRVYAMPRDLDVDLMDEWRAKGPQVSDDNMFSVLTVKAFYDAALGSRGAHLLEDYADRPGHRGVSGEDYGFDEELLRDMAGAGFQLSIHAIGDAGNRATLDFLESVIASEPDSRRLRHRIEHAQVLHPDDIPRFARSNIIASMEPVHAVEDKGWAEDRLGPERVRSAYAWRSLRHSGARLAFNSDLAGSDHDIFYGLHAAITRRDKDLQPEGGWYPEQCMTPEEAIRGYTVWNAYTVFAEDKTGKIEPGLWGDITVMDIDPMRLGIDDPDRLLGGSILLTVVDGKIAYRGMK
jgi:predicted amidohydrolase YtcJ